MCSMGQIRSEGLDEAFPKLVSFVEKEDMEGSATEEDVTTGFELFLAVVYCPLATDIKLFRFVNRLLSNESARTIIQTFVNLVRSGVKPDVRGFTLIKEFYGVLASTLNLQYGNVLLATSTNSQLQTMIDNEWPFFTNHTDLVKNCLSGSHCDSIQDRVQRLGKNFL